MKATPIERLGSLLDSKRHIATADGFDPVFMPDRMHDLQAYCAEWAIRKGRSGCFLDCGLGKTGIGAVAAENFARKSGRPVLVCTPPAVGPQWIEEAARFGVEATASRGDVHRITVTNWSLLHRFNPSDFGSLVGSESSIMKSFDGATKSAATEFMRKIRWRLLETGTPSPNNFIELGTHSEALGYIGYMDMLARYFVNDQRNSGTRRHFGEAPKWRFKGHAEIPFFKDVCSWARAARKPSDLGFSDAGFVLPSLNVREHLIESESIAPGKLFTMPVNSLPEQRAEKRRTLEERCAYARDLVKDTGKPFAIWCHLNDEGNMLQKMIPDAVQVAGGDEDKRFDKFEAFRKGNVRGVITKPKIAGWGQNWQHCAHTIYFVDHSEEAYYQCVRRFWRFGQKSDVTVDIPLTEGERLILENLNRKSANIELLFSRFVELMNESEAASGFREFTEQMEVPQWLSSIN